MSTMFDSPRTSEILMLLTEMQAAHAEAARCATRIQSLLLGEAANPTPDAPRFLPIADAETMSVHWKGKSCQLKSEIRFKLFERLARRPNFYVTYRQLQVDVWGGEIKSRESLRSMVRLLKQDLRRSGMADLARAIRGEEKRYGLILEGLG